MCDKFFDSCMSIYRIRPCCIQSNHKMFRALYTLDIEFKKYILSVVPDNIVADANNYFVRKYSDYEEDKKDSVISGGLWIWISKNLPSVVKLINDLRILIKEYNANNQLKLS